MVIFALTYSLLYSVTGWVAWWGIKTFNQDYHWYAGVAVPNLSDLKQIAHHLNEVRSGLYYFAAENLSTPVKDPKESKEQLATYRTQIEAAETAYKKVSDHYLSTPFDIGEEAIYNKALAAADRLIPAINKDMGLLEEDFKNNWPAVSKNMTEMVHPLLEEVLGYVAQTFDQTQRNSDGHLSESLDHLGDLKIVLGLWVLLFIVIGLMISRVFANSTVSAIEHVIKILRNALKQVTSDLGGLMRASESLAQTSSEQAASLQATGSSLNQIAAMITRSTESARHASENASQSHENAEDGRTAVADMLTAMQNIHESNDAIMNQVQQSNRRMEEIVGMIKQIGAKTQVINDIVFQTKLLSFNASVEAARSGEHGSGFSVVAEEIANLAQTSGNAAEDISQMLQGSVGSVINLVADMQSRVEKLTAEGKRKVGSGIMIAKRSAEILEEIVLNSGKVANLANEISAASMEQAQGVSDINRRVTEMDSITHGNAATSEKVQNSTQVLHNQMQQLSVAMDLLSSAVIGAQEQDAFEEFMILRHHEHDKKVAPFKGKVSPKKLQKRSAA
jgi:methyl-accepting chemotaxis protein